VFLTPREGGPKIVNLDFRLLDTLLIVARTRGVDQGRQGGVVVAVAGTHGLGLAGLAQFVRRVLAHRLHPDQEASRRQQGPQFLRLLARRSPIVPRQGLLLRARLRLIPAGLAAASRSSRWRPRLASAVRQCIWGEATACATDQPHGRGGARGWQGAPREGRKWRGRRGTGVGAESDGCHRGDFRPTTSDPTSCAAPTPSTRE
jgi:hypothetical protein